MASEEHQGEVVEFDIDDEYAAQAQEREAKGKRIVMRLEGKVFHFRPSGEWDFRTTRQIGEDNDIEAFAYEALDDDEAETFLKLDFPTGKFNLLMERINDASGLGRGKGPGSTKSSRKRRKK